ncbi:PglB [Ammoniphilus sp. YIM 78166]|uniref:PglD-related sugar-binding protein n=1 Tax=Ammoniphilus sp. YIM 78166 TaxID=1644106 RepID=UPI00106FBD07|nr:PglB [Ammoniphilus sp. YIM 78166]
MINNLLILGAGGHGRVVRETAEAMGCFERIESLDDNSESAIGRCKDLKRYINDYSYAFVAFGNNNQRMKWIKEITEAGFQLPVLIHPTAYVSPSAKIGVGSILCSRAVVNTSAVIEKGCIISICVSRS